MSNNYNSLDFLNCDDPDNCSQKYNVVHFSLYFNDLLSNEEKTELRDHARACLHCRFSFEFFAEFHKNNFKVTNGEELNYIKFLHSKCWDLAKKQLTEDIKAELRPLISYVVKSVIEEKEQEKGVVRPPNSKKNLKSVFNLALSIIFLAITI